MRRKLLLGLLIAAAAMAMAPGSASAMDPDVPQNLVTEADVVGIRIRQALAGEGAQAADRSDREAVREFYQERRGQTVWVSEEGATSRGTSVMAEIRRADEWGLKASDFELPNVRAVGSRSAALEPDKLADAEVKIALAVLKYARFARGGRFNPVDLSPDLDLHAQLLNPRSVLKAASEMEAPGNYLRRLHPKHAGFEKLRQLYLSLRGSGEIASQPIARRRAKPRREGPEDVDGTAAALPGAGARPDRALKVLANMERWRYLPDDLGRLHVWTNVPEFVTRVIKDGKPIFTELIVAGRPDTQTTIFSARMEEIVFHPYWNVPGGIKSTEIIPKLRTGTKVLAENHLGVRFNGHEIDARTVNWSTVDARKYDFFQAPSVENVLGAIKFTFPNKHDIYMHDTPSKGLFAAETRIFSHGCMRVRNPNRLAELLLAEDKGWSPGKVRELIAGGPDNHITLSHKIPVYINYFTVWIDEAGRPQFRDDYYGHDQRMMDALRGRPVQEIARDSSISARTLALSKQMAEVERRRREAERGGGSLFGWLLN